MCETAGWLCTAMSDGRGLSTLLATPVSLCFALFLFFTHSSYLSIVLSSTVLTDALPCLVLTDACILVLVSSCPTPVIIYEASVASSFPLRRLHLGLLPNTLLFLILLPFLLLFLLLL